MSKIIVLITCRAQICPKLFLAVMTLRYIAFILTKNWFGQTLAGMGNWYYMGRWVNVLNFRKKMFFKISTFFCFENDLSVIFGFITPKLITLPIFIKIQWTKLKLSMKMHCQDFQDDHQEDKGEGLLSKLLIAISQKLFEIEPWNLVLYLHSMYICSKFHWNLKRWVSGMSHCGISRSIFMAVQIIWIWKWKQNVWWKPCHTWI